MSDKGAKWGELGEGEFMLPPTHKRIRELESAGRALLEWDAHKGYLTGLDTLDAIIERFRGLLEGKKL